jgi:hypothetical protein
MMLILRRHIQLFLLILTVCTAQAQHQRFPFTREENLDGSKFVWFVYNLNGYSYRYMPAKTFPPAGRFIRLSGAHPQESDVAWWDRFMGLYGGDSARTVMTAEGNIPLEKLVRKYGPVKWFSYLRGAPDALGLRIFGGRLTFTIPDSVLWKQKDRQFNQETQKGLVLFERDSLIDAEGTASQPIMSLLYQPLPPGTTDVSMFAENSPLPEGMKVASVDTVDHSLLYHCSYNNGTDHSVLILYIAEKGAGISVICDAATSVFEPVQQEFLSFLQSVQYGR